MSSKLVAVKGMTLAFYENAENDFTVGAYTISAEDTNVTCDGKGVYAGTVTVACATGSATADGYSQTAAMTWQLKGTAIATASGKKLVLEGTEAKATSSFARGNSSRSVTVTCEIKSAGQSNFFAED